MPAGSAHGSCVVTCRLMTARALRKPPPWTAEESMVSGHSLVTSTASRFFRMPRISIMRAASETDPQADQDIGPESREAAHLRIALVEKVLHPQDEIHALDPVVLLEHAVRAAEVHARVAAVVDLAEGLPLLRHDMDLGEERETPHRLPRQPDVPPVLRLARQPAPGLEILRVRVRVVHGCDEIAQEVRLARELDACRPRRAHVDRAAEGSGGYRAAAGDQVLELVVEVRQAQADPPLPELLIDSGIVGHAALRLEVGVSEVGEEEVVEGRRAEARAGPAADARARLLDREGQRAPLGRRAAEDAVVFVPEAARKEEPVEEAQLLLEEDRRHMTARVEGALVVALLVAVADPHRAGAPRAHVDGVEPLDLATLDVDLRDGRDIEVHPGIRRVLEPDVVLVARESHRALPPRHGPRLRLEQHHRRLALLPGIGVDDGVDGLGPRKDALDGHADLALVVAHDEGSGRVQRQRHAEPPVQRVDIRAVVLELPIALEM